MTGAFTRWRSGGVVAEARRQRALAELGQRALEGADSRVLLEQATATLARVLAVPFGAVLEWTPDGDRLVMRAGFGWRAEVVGSIVADVASAPGLARTLAGLDPVALDGGTLPLLAEHGVASAVAVGIDGRDAPYGVLIAGADRRRRFSDPEAAWQRDVARTLAIALRREYGERALFEEMQMSALLTHVGRDIMGCVALPMLAERLCEITVEALHCDHSVTWLGQPGEADFRAVAVDGILSAQWDGIGSVVLPRDAVASLLEDLTGRESLRVDSPNGPHPLIRLMQARTGIATALWLPLRKRDRIVGLQMCGHREHGGRFGAEEERVAQGIAQLASTALLNVGVIEELERASALKSEFVSTMSHELRTPLNIIIGYTDMLQDAATPEEQAPLLAHVRRASGELLDLIEGTLNLNRLAAGGDMARFAPIPLRDLWRELEHDFNALTRRSDAELRWEACPDLTLETDRRKLKIVLKNLVGNALKFTAQGEVVVRCRTAEGQCRFEVRDTGVGIVPEAIPHVFEMFRQVDSSDTRSYGGAGLGLYIVKSLVVQLGGTVFVESEVGKGSTFSVALPLAQPHVSSASASAVAPAAQAAAPCPHGPRRRLLFADDLPLNRLLLERFVAREFPEVEMLEACDGEQAVTMYQAHRPDLVLLDLHMPNLDGWQAARRIRELEGGREIPILALSVDASPLAEANAVRSGFKEFIAKPISDYSSLKTRVAYWLAQRARSRGPVAACELCGGVPRDVTAA